VRSQFLIHGVEKNMCANGVEAAIARYREAEKKRCAQSELRASGERVLGGFTVLMKTVLR